MYRDANGGLNDPYLNYDRLDNSTINGGIKLNCHGSRDNCMRPPMDSFNNYSNNRGNDLLDY